MWLSSARFPRLRGQSFFQYNLRLWNCVWDNLCTLLCLYFAANQYHTLTQVSLENILILGKQKLSFGSTRWTRIWGAKWRDARAKSLKFSCCCGYSQKIRPRRLQEKKGGRKKGEVVCEKLRKSRVGWAKRWRQLGLVMVNAMWAFAWPLAKFLIACMWCRKNGKMGKTGWWREIVLHIYVCTDQRTVWRLL